MPRKHSADLRRLFSTDEIRLRVNNAGQNTLNEVGNEIKEMFANSIRNQVGFQSFVPLASSTIYKKMKHGNEDLMIIDTEDMLNGLIVEPISDKPAAIKITFSKDKGTGRASPMQKAQINEFGTKDGHVPARPFMRVTLDNIREDVKKLVTSRFNVKFG